MRFWLVEIYRASSFRGSNCFPRKRKNESDFKSNRTWAILGIDYVSENQSCEIALDYVFLQRSASEARSLWALSRANEFV